MFKHLEPVATTTHNSCVTDFIFVCSPWPTHFEVCDMVVASKIKKEKESAPTAKAKVQIAKVRIWGGFWWCACVCARSAETNDYCRSSYSIGKKKCVFENCDPTKCNPRS